MVGNLVVHGRYSFIMGSWLTVQGPIIPLFLPEVGCASGEKPADAA